MAATSKPYKIKAKGAIITESALIAPYQSLYGNPISILTSSKNGLSAKAAIDFLNLSGFSKEEFQDTFKTNVKTIQNYVSNSSKLDASLSEKLLKSFSLFDKGIAVFGSAKAFHQWLNMPSYGLGNQIPFDLMDTITGISLIEEELIRIEYGDLA
jgi:putative toxin-antitoxin system antitoxin component (TIGR02293 family)